MNTFTEALPERLYSADDARAFDRAAIAAGTPGRVLMQRAGAAAFRLLCLRWPRARKFAVVCGTGNNGGDGFVLATLARAAGFDMRVLGVTCARPTTPDAQAAFDDWRAASGTVSTLSSALLDDREVIVDALFGIGLTRPIEGEWADAVATINAAGHPVLALDVPSGLDADTGAVHGCAVRADATLSFIVLKAGLFTHHGRALCGEIFCDDLGVPDQIIAARPPVARRLTAENLSGLFPRRARDLHKGQAGHVLVIGGQPGMSGAARLAGEAAQRVGAGLVSIATHPAHATTLGAGRPELMVQGIEDAQALRALAARATVLAIGPGLGESDWARTLWAAATDLKQPRVIDADGLRWLAAAPQQRADGVLTPHPGEAARLLRTTTQEIQANRFAAVREIAREYGGVCVLKGSGTLISAADGPLWLCDAGNPGMASGGMGDVLTGVIAALRAQGLLPAIDAARLAVWLHAVAADELAAGQGEIGLLASDLLPVIRRRLNAMVAS